MKLQSKENARDTMYAEILNLVASFETGIAFEIQKYFKKVGRKLQPNEVDEMFMYFSEHPLKRPHIEGTRIKMAIPCWR